MSEMDSKPPKTLANPINTPLRKELKKEKEIGKKKVGKYS